MQSFQIYKNLAWLNGLPAAEAESIFRDCSGSEEWARRMVESRPFQMLDDLYRAAYRVWFSLSGAEWLEAFAALAGSEPDAANETQVSAAVDSVGEIGLAEAGRLYQDKFGFIFVICPTDRTVDEMLAICKARLSNSAETEIHIAAEEQRKLIEARLNAILER